MHPVRTRVVVVACLSTGLLTLLAGCPPPGGGDAGGDSGVAVGGDSGVDASGDSGVDAGSDSGGGAVDAGACVLTANGRGPQTGESCLLPGATLAWTGPGCNGQPAPHNCVCTGGQWNCGQPCDLTAMCPAIEQVTRGGACSVQAGVRCPTNESRYPPECHMSSSEPNSCECVNGQWVCFTYAIACDAGVPADAASRD